MCEHVFSFNFSTCFVDGNSYAFCIHTWCEIGNLHNVYVEPHLCMCIRRVGFISDVIWLNLSMNEMSKFYSSHISIWLNVH